MAKPRPSKAPIPSDRTTSLDAAQTEVHGENFTQRMQTDVRGRYHVWIESLDPQNLATTDDLYRVARESVSDFDKREWDLSAETLKPGVFHLVEKGFISWPTTS